MPLRPLLPGGVARAYVERLAATECPAFTARRARRAERSGAPHDPIVWRRAAGDWVEDVDGNRFVDLSSGFGVASLGHAHPAVVAAVQRQAGRLMHALGDVHPSDVKIDLLQRLVALAPWPEARVVLGLHGGDAIEVALKTAVLATGRAGVLAFRGGYHGLQYGPLAACGYADGFRQPFAAQLNPQVAWAPFPSEATPVTAALGAVAEAWDAAQAKGVAPIGAVLIEPLQGRGGVHVPPTGFLAGLGELCHARGALLIADEILTGLHRCGPRWLSVAEGVDIDLLCIGKSLGGGMPMSACLGRAEVMAAWGDPAGEALHTATFFGHPVGCAAALAALEALDQPKRQAQARAIERQLRAGLLPLMAKHACVLAVRGRGALFGLELDEGARTLRLVRRLLEHGFLCLPAGEAAQVLQLMPPLTIEGGLLDAFLAVLARLLADER